MLAINTIFLYVTTHNEANQIMSKTNTQPKNLYYLLLGFLIAMVSIAEASTKAVGEWKLKEVWREDEAEPLSITRDGDNYIMTIFPPKGDNKDHHRFNVKVGNSIGSSMDILEEDGDEQKIKVGFVMSTRMFAGSQEKEELEGYLDTHLANMVLMKIKGDGEELVLSSEAGARIVCEPSTESEN